MRLLPFALLTLACGSSRSLEGEHPDRSSPERGEDYPAQPADADDEPDDKPDDENQPDNSPPPDTEDPPDEDDDRFWPVEGDWSLIETAIAVDRCGLGDHVSGDVTEAASLQLTGGRKFTLVHHFGEDSCVLESDGPEFDCNNRLIVDTTARDDYGLDADIRLDVVPSGTFIDAETVDLSADLTANCTGSDCGLLSTFTGANFPCEMELYLSAIAD
jgi:hypothetical protein